MTSFYTFLVARGVDGSLALLIDGGILFAIALLIILSKTIVDIIDESPVIFSLGALFVFGLVPWLILWALTEVVLSYYYNKKSKKEKVNEPEVVKEDNKPEVKDKKYI